MDRKRKQSLRARRVKGTTDCPRMAVFCSLSHIYVQLIDDERGLTLAQASTVKKGLKANIAGAKAVGQAVAESAKQKSLTRVVLDRRTRKYHGCIKALADAAREGGLQF